MEKIQELYSLCKCGVSISINEHKNYYESVFDYLGNNVEIIDSEILSIMEQLNTVVEIQFYPDTPNGFHIIHHYDLESAVDKCLEILKSNK